MAGAGQRRRLGVSGLSSLGAHGMVVITCLIGRAAGGQLRQARYLGPGPVEPLAVELVSPAELQPDPEPAPASRLPAPSLTPAVVARGGKTRHPRPVRAQPALRLPSRGNPLLAPPSPAYEGEDDDDPSTPDGPAPVTAGAGGEGSSAHAPRPIPLSENYPVSPLQASYLRVYQTFPSVPSALWSRQRVFSIELKVCVAPDGAVSGVTLTRSTVQSLDDAVVAAARTWRYRPLVVEGAARPFCHLILIHYMTE
jgi:TonB family protein